MQDFGDICERAARAGGEVLTRMRGKVQVREKAPADLVTEADLGSQEAIRDLVLRQFPDHAFVGEEDLTTDDAVQTTADYTWIVDPLDGTTNYVHGLENYCVSVALQHQSKTIAGAIHDPVRDISFCATLGHGAFCNGVPMRVSSVDTVNKALIAASFPARVERDSAEVKRFLEILVRCQAIRRLGSAALNLCYVAAGRLDAYWATSVKKWDVAAGVLIVSEAGGLVSSLDGSVLDIESPKLIAAGQARLHAEMIAILSSVDDIHRAAP